MKKIRPAVMGVIILVILQAAGCSTNSLLIRYFYSQMDDNMSKRIQEYATFDSVQAAEIEKSVDDFFRWHRQNELPRYAAYLESISRKIDIAELDQQQVLAELENIRKLSRQGFLRTPFARSAPFLKTLSDTQVNEVAEYMRQKDQRFMEWYRERQENGGNEARLKAIVKNIGRFGVKLNTQQRAIIRDGLDNYRGGPLERFRVWNAWEARFLALLKNRHEPGFEQQASELIAAYQDQMRLHDPVVDLHNRKISANMITQILGSLDKEQKRTLIKKLRQTRNALQSISGSQLASTS